ncbi:Glucooligosaccharide oxidase [Nemania sp. FL0031]|nr:Glucooligosaccharide oxidase [Nemania sp. FL0031]
MDASIEIKTPTDPDWELHSSTFNTRVPVIPAIVALPVTIEQVSQAVRWAAARGLKVQARSGGHSYASHSNGGVDGSVVVDLRKLQDIALNEDGVVRVGGGVRLGKLAKTIFEQGGRALAHGTCPSVGIGGHFTHGGFGFTSRAWGLSTDQIVAADVVLADGRVVRASESENGDIFYAVRGAANSFGIVVNFYLRTQPAPEVVLNWSIDMPDAMESVKTAVKVFLRLQDFANGPSVDRKLGLVVFLGHKRFSIEGTYLGDIGTFMSTVWPALMRVVPETGEIKVRCRRTDWPTLIALLAGDAELDVGPDHTEHEEFFAKSAVVLHPGLSRAALKDYFSLIASEDESPPIPYFIGIQLFGGRDSQISANTADDAYAHRNALWMFQHHGFAKGDEKFTDEGIRFLEGLNAALGPGHGAAINYADASLKSGEAQKLYYGEQLGRLMKLKSVLDPNDVFSHPQSIRGEDGSDEMLIDGN